MRTSGELRISFEFAEFAEPIEKNHERLLDGVGRTGRRRKKLGAAR
jgi:hypothetical protein